MKKILTLMIVVIAASFSVSVHAGTPIKQSELPKAAQTFLSKHFPGDNVRKAEKEQGRRGAEYEVDLVSGAEVDFTDNGDWKEVKAAKGQSVPAAIIPSAISNMYPQTMQVRASLKFHVNVVDTKLNFLMVRNSS